MSPTHGFGPAYINTIQRSGGLNVVKGGAVSEWSGVAANVTAPVWGRGGALLALHGRELVVLSSGGHHTRAVAGPLSVRGSGVFYGFVPWLDSFAWSDARVGGLAGTS